MQFKYCPLCRGELSKKNYKLFICRKCGFHFYINPKPSNAAILKNGKGKILLVKRKYPPKKNSWGLPGGFVEINETVEDSLRRELKEELGIFVKKIKYFSSFTDRYFYQGINYYVLVNFFVGGIKNQRPIPDDDISEFAFFSSSEIPFEKIAFKSFRQVIKDYFQTGKP